MKQIYFPTHSNAHSSGFSLIDFDVFGIYITHSFDFNGVIDEAQDDIRDSEKWWY